MARDSPVACSAPGHTFELMLRRLATGLAKFALFHRGFFQIDVIRARGNLTKMSSCSRLARD
jgi:hypothetical protein